MAAVAAAAVLQAQAVPAAVAMLYRAALEGHHKGEAAARVPLVYQLSQVAPAAAQAAQAVAAAAVPSVILLAKPVQQRAQVLPLSP